MNFVPSTDAGKTYASDTVSAVEYPLQKSAWGDAGTVNQTSTTNPLPISVAAANFIFSTLNSTTTQLAASATFTGTIEDLRSQPAISIQLTSDQPGTLTVIQYIDSGGTRVSGTWTFSNVANVPFNQALTFNGNYVKVTYQNTGASTTTTLNLNTAYGTIDPVSNLGNLPVAIDEVNGTALNLGQTTMAASLPVAIASNQSAVPVSGTFWQATQPVSSPVSDPQFVMVGNSNRTELRFYAVAAAAGTTGTETAITLTKSSGTSATTTGTSFVVTNGKRFKITHLSVATRGHATATVQTTTFNLRQNTAGAVTTTSTPIILSARSATPATASAWDRYVITLPADGIELVGNGTMQFGITAAATYTTNAPTWDVTIIGYEY